MRLFRWIPRSGTISALLALVLVFTRSQCLAQTPSAKTPQVGAPSISEDRLLQPEILSRLLQTSTAEKPLVLQVGSHVLYAEAHIPQSEYAGAGGQAEGLLHIQKRVALLPRSTFIVLYCGCCPWNRCPNIEPALRQLKDMGFTNVKVLYLASDFGTDWVSRGYQVEHGR